MDASQLIDSLSLEQLAAVYAIRDSILAQHTTAEAAFVAINQQLTVDIAKANTDKSKAEISLAEKTTAYDAEVVKVTALTEENDTLKTTIATANATITRIAARVTHLESIKPFNDGLIKIEAFMERCKPYMARLMFAANDEIPANGFGDIVSILNAKSKIGEPVNLNSTMFNWALSKIRTLDNVTEEEIATLTKPASREEAYIEVFGE